MLPVNLAGGGAGTHPARCAGVHAVLSPDLRGDGDRHGRAGGGSPDGNHREHRVSRQHRPRFESRRTDGKLRPTSSVSKIVLTLEMWIGRLEVLTVFVLFRFEAWRTSRWASELSPELPAQRFQGVEHRESDTAYTAFPPAGALLGQPRIADRSDIDAAVSAAASDNRFQKASAAQRWRHQQDP